MSRIGKSEAQSIAEARTITFADEHAKARVRVFSRTEPTTLRGLVNELRQAYADELPTKLHEGPNHVDGGGTPKFTGSFEHYLYGSPFAIDEDDESSTPAYLTPFRAMLAGMQKANDPMTQRRARIVAHITIGNQSATDAAIAEGAAELDARLSAMDAMKYAWRRLDAVRLDLAKTATAA